MANCSLGFAVSWICFVISIATMGMGFLYVFLRFKEVDPLDFDGCDIKIGEFCKWRMIFTIRPTMLLDLWTPVIMGLLGTAVHVHALRFSNIVLWFLPHGYVGYGVFMIIMALVANFGYCGQLGLILAFCSLAGALLCFIARCAMEGGIISVYSRWAYAG
mmetsp:Transcript_90907/g.190081  ORF Transcript_90907/g.190081 Transcript_90907/m.190081 type:complete len:160 (-) Transcript_90907:267-746(-)